MAPHTGGGSGGNSAGGIVVKHKLVEVARRYSQLVQVASLVRQVVNKAKKKPFDDKAACIDSKVEEGASTSWLLVLYSPKFAPKSPKIARYVFSSENILDSSSINVYF